MGSGIDLILAGICVCVALILVWFSMALEREEVAVGRVARTSLNDLILQVRSDEDLTQFEKQKKLRRLERIKVFISDRTATTAGATFCRIMLNVFVGVLVAVAVILFGLLWWMALLVGVACAVIVGAISLVVRAQPRDINNPIKFLLTRNLLLFIAISIVPSTHKSSSNTNKAATNADEENDNNDSDLDDDELEKLRIEHNKEVIDHMIETSETDPEVGDMLRNVVQLSDTLTREIMVPRTDMVCVGQNDALSSVLKLFSRSGFSRIPVIGGDVDDLVGVAYLKDAIRAVLFNDQAKERPVSSIARKPLLVPESKPVDDLFHQMQQERQHIAIVVDEYGGIAGLVTIEDAIEQIVGALEDEHDRTQHVDPVEIEPQKWRMPARTPINDVEEIFEIDIDEDEVDTVYGLLTKLLGSVPVVGQSAVTHGLKFTAVDSAGRRKKVSMVEVEPVDELLHDDSHK